AVGCTLSPGVTDVSVKWPDDIRHTKTVQHTLRRNVTRSTRAHVEDPTGLPVFREPRPESGRIPEKKFARADRQFKRAVVDDYMTPICGQQRVVCGPIGGIRESGAEPVWTFPRGLSQVTAPGVSQLRTHSGSRSKRNLGLQRMIVGVSQVCFH